MADQQPDPAYDALDAAVLSAISDNLRADGDAAAPYVTGYVLLADWQDDEGSPRLFGVAMQGQTASRSLGLLAMGEERERSLLRRHFEAREADDE